eukprot:8942712-Pyramimonas_sp.AAC.1
MGSEQMGSEDPATTQMHRRCRRCIGNAGVDKIAGSASNQIAYALAMRRDPSRAAKSATRK